VDEKRLSFTTQIKAAAKKSQIIFIAVGTPQGENGSADMKYVLKAAETIAKNMDGYKAIKEVCNIDDQVIPMLFRIGHADPPTAVSAKNSPVIINV